MRAFGSCNMTVKGQGQNPVLLCRGLSSGSDRNPRGRVSEAAMGGGVNAITYGIGLMWLRGQLTRPLPEYMWQPSAPAAPPRGSRGRFSVSRETLSVPSSLARRSVYVKLLSCLTPQLLHLPLPVPCCARGCHGTRGVICAVTMCVKSRPGLGLQRHGGLFPLEMRPVRSVTPADVGRHKLRNPVRTSAERGK